MTGTGGGLIAAPMVRAPIDFRAEPGGARATKNSFLNCAKCKAPGRIRRSQLMSETVTQMTVHCTNSACGHIWKSDIVFVHSLVEGNIDRPDLNLPVCPKEELVHVYPPGGGEDDEQVSMFEPPPG